MVPNVGYKAELQALANNRVIGSQSPPCVGYVRGEALVTACPWPGDPCQSFPPGTSKWNPIEHRLFGPISIHWRGQPLSSFATIVHDIANTTTQTGLTVHAVLDPREYATGRKVEDATLAALNLARNDFHGNWNYVIKPQPMTAESA